MITTEQCFAVDAMSDVMALFAPILGQYLDDEEDIVIPLILELAQADPKFG